METHKETQERKARIGSTATLDREIIPRYKGDWFENYQRLPDKARTCIDESFVFVQRFIAGDGYQVRGDEEKLLSAITLYIIDSNPELTTFLSEPERSSER